MKRQTIIGTIALGLVLFTRPDGVPGASAQQPTVQPTSAGEQLARVSVQVVYDANNDGSPGPEDYPLTTRDATLTAASGDVAPVAAKGGAETDVPAGTYVIFATGPRYLSGEEGKPGAICRGWRTSYVVGVPISKIVEQPSAGLGFAVDLAAATDATSPPTEIVLGLSDKGAKGTEFDGVQITCPELGASATLPATGSGDDGVGAGWRLILLVAASASAFAALCAALWSRRRAR